MKKLNLKISGMHCASCAANIEKSVKKIGGVKSVNVSLMMNKGYVEAEDNVGEEQIKQAVQRAGYKVLSVEKQ